MVTRSYAERKRMFDRVQAIVVENQPLVPLVSPNLLAGAKRGWPTFSRLPSSLILCGISISYTGAPGPGARQ